MPLRPDPDNPDLMVYVKHEYNLPKEWQGLTDEEVEEVERWVEFKEEGSGRIPTGKLIRYIEAKLRGKNT